MERRTRVLHVIGSLQVGGAESQLLAIVRGLGDRFEFHVGLLSEGGPLEESVRAAGGRIHPLLPGGAGRRAAPRLWLALRARSRLRSLLRDLAPDIIHAWLFETSFLAAAARWPSRTPRLIVSRRNLLEWFARQSVYLRLSRWTCGRADLLIANSEAVRADVQKKEKVGGERFIVIYNGVDTDRFRQREPAGECAVALGLPAGLPVVGAVANCHFYKGHLELLEAASLLRGQGRRFTLLFIGGEGDASEAIRARAPEVGVPVIFAGTRHDVERLLPLMTVFVSASHEEGFSNSILEAMACGRAVVATAVGGTPEQIVDAQNGRLVPPRDPASLAVALDGLLADPALRRRLGQAARQTVEQKFSLGRLHEEMGRIYRELAASRPSPVP